MIIVYLISLVLAGAAGDGLNNSGRQRTGHWFQALEILMAFCYTIIFKMFTWDLFLISLGAYTAFRVALFDIAYNITAGNKWTYAGGDNWWDRFVVKFPVHGVTFARLIFLGLGIFLVINEL